MCNNNKICEKTLNYVGVNISENLIVSFNFFRSNSPLKFWESCRHFKRHNNCFLFCWTDIEWFVKTGYIPEATWDRMPQSSGIFMYWTCYVNRVDIEKVLDEFSSKKVRSKFFFQTISVPKYVCDIYKIRLNLAKKVISKFYAFHQRES